MKAIFAVAILCGITCGCKDKAGPAIDSPATVGISSSTKPSAGGTSGVTPIGPAVGPITPVTGGEDLGSSTGGGIAQMAKSQARKAAGQSSTPPGAGDADSQ